MNPNPKVEGNVIPQALAFEMAPCIPSTMLISTEILHQIPRLESLPSDDVAFNIELSQITEYAFVDSVVIKRQPGGAGIGGDEETVQNRWDTIEEYQKLYMEHPNAYDRAVAATNLLAAQSEFRKQRWSMRAILYACRAARYSPSVATAGYAASSLFGRAGRDAARKIYSKYILSEENEGKIW